MGENHEGKRLRAYIRANDILIDSKDESEDYLLKKLSFTKSTLYSLFREEHIDPEYRKELLAAGVHYLTDSPQMITIKPGPMTQEEEGLSLRVRELEKKLSDLQQSMINLQASVIALQSKPS